MTLSLELRTELNANLGELSKILTNENHSWESPLVHFRDSKVHTHRDQNGSRYVWLGHGKTAEVNKNLSNHIMRQHVSNQNVPRSLSWCVFLQAYLFSFQLFNFSPGFCFRVGALFWGGGRTVTPKTWRNGLVAGCFIMFGPKVWT